MDGHFFNKNIGTSSLEPDCIYTLLLLWLVLCDLMMPYKKIDDNEMLSQPQVVL